MNRAAGKLPPWPQREALVRCLVMQRTGVLRIVEGLPTEALRSSVLPTGWTCLGLVQQLTVNERYWFRWAIAGEQLPGARSAHNSRYARLEVEDVPYPITALMGRPPDRTVPLMRQTRRLGPAGIKPAPALQGAVLHPLSCEGGGLSTIGLGGWRPCTHPIGKRPSDMPSAALTEPVPRRAHRAAVAARSRRRRRDGDKPGGGRAWER